MRNKVTYRDLQSMQQLRVEREKLRWQLRSAEDVLQRDYRQVCEKLTLANLLRMALNKIENVQALISGVRDGYRSISALFRHKKEQ